MLEGFYNSFMGLVLLFAFGGFIFVVAIVLIAVSVSAAPKIGRLARGYRPRTAFAVISELVFVIPFFVIVYLFYQLLF
jgi:hypothetical protein